MRFAPSPERQMRAEGQIARLRLGLLLAGHLIYEFLLPQDVGSPRLAYGWLTFAWCYGLALWLGEPYRRWPRVFSSLWISVLDAAFTLLWIAATGGYASPFYLAIYMGIIAVALRFGQLETLLAACVYAAGYGAVLATRGELLANLNDMTVRLTYIFLAAATGRLDQ